MNQRPPQSLITAALRSDQSQDLSFFSRNVQICANLNQCPSMRAQRRLISHSPPTVSVTPLPDPASSSRLACSRTSLYLFTLSLARHQRLEPPDYLYTVDCSDAALHTMLRHSHVARFVTRYGQDATTTSTSSPIGKLPRNRVSERSGFPGRLVSNRFTNITESLCSRTPRDDHEERADQNNHIPSFSRVTTDYPCLHTIWPRSSIKTP